MDSTGLDKMVRQLTAGFEALQDEYQKLHGQHQVLERKLDVAREQYNELAKLYGSRQTSTPPLSLSSIPGPQREVPSRISASEILDQSSDIKSREAASIIRTADAAARVLRNGLPITHASTSNGVKIWSGPSADKPDAPASSMMPSISESPLEQDFTVEGKPSQLGCPFTSMASKKLSSHAASVLSRYNQSNSACALSTRTSSVSRVDGRESIRRQRQDSSSHRRESFVDPIRAEICGMAEAHAGNPATTTTTDEDRAALTRIPSKPSRADPAAETGVCPIRFLDQHSPEEVATYFENHKHELPRSHEWCVLRYQANEDQIRELDAKYGNLVSMIQGLGAKHKDMLPDEPQEEEEQNADDEAGSDEKVRKWAHSVSAQAVNGDNLDGGELPAAGSQDDLSDEGDGDDDKNSNGNDNERQPRFARPLRDIRVGESPSRPWGIPVPAKYLEKAESVTSSQPVEVALANAPAQQRDRIPAPPPKQTTQSAAKCPFSQLGATASPPTLAPLATAATDHPPKVVPPAGGKCPFGHSAAAELDKQKAEKSHVQSAHDVPNVPLEAHLKTDTHAAATPEPSNVKTKPNTASSPSRPDAPVIINGPVFIGYSADDAIRILRESGLQLGQSR